MLTLSMLLLTLIAALMAAKTEPPPRVQLVRVPNAGEPLEARMSPDGSIHLLYQSGGIPYYVKSGDGGASFGRAIPVVGPEWRKPGLEFAGAAMAVAQGGAVHVAMMTNNWKVKLPGVPEGLAYATLPAGAKAFTPIVSLNGRPSEGFSLAADENGNVAATWLAGKLFANFSHDGGRTFSANAEINPAYDPCDCCTTRAAYGGDGSLAVLYREETNNQRDMHVVILGKDGRAKDGLGKDGLGKDARQSRTRISSTLWTVNACPMTYFSLSATKTGYVAAWPTKGEIYFARLDQNGKVLPPGEIKTPGRSGMRTGVVALGAGDGVSLIAWRHQDEVGWQLYGADGNPLGAVGSMKSAGKGAAAVVDRMGRFLLFQ
jgi:hypothetical protein